MGRIVLLSSFLCVAWSVRSQADRIVRSVNSNWLFQKGETIDSAKWERINLPHTWNAHDPFDEEPGYYRGIGWYKRSFTLTTLDTQWFLRFEGVNQVAEIFVNGSSIKGHKGGYTAFNVPLSGRLRSGSNEILVKVDNSHNDEIAPLKGDFNFYGGIYRDVWLISTSATHFNFSEYGDLGIFISTPQVSAGSATVNVRADIKSDTSGKKHLNFKLISPQGETVLEYNVRISLEKGLNRINELLPEVSHPQLWHPDHPQLYQLIVSILNNEGKIMDRQQVPVGFRWFKFDADEGFFINDEHLKLMGTNRHQDYEGLGNALSDDRHRNDVQLIKNMGSNFFRTAHYPQDPAVLQASDQLGLLVSMEIPLDHEITDSKGFYSNTKFMMQEMIRQNYNHPCIIIWAYMNEMLLGRQMDKDNGDIQKIVAFAKVLEQLTREEDPTRYTMIPNHGALGLYHEAGLTDIPMIVGWNLYYGWYANTMGGGGFLDDFHQLIPDKPVIVTEYGAGSDPRIRSFDPVRFDFSIEWQTRFHHKNIQDFMERKFLAGSALWNIADFGSENRKDAVPKINSKGIVTAKRKPKDTYYLYQAWLNDSAFVKIGGCDWTKRTSYDNLHPFEIYTNGAPGLLVNGENVNGPTVDAKLARYEIPLREGKNILEATSIKDNAVARDVCEIYFDRVDPEWVKSNTIHINCGSNFYFIDPVDDVTWLPDVAYSGFLGYESGKAYQPRDLGVGADSDILNTKLEPVYQTGRIKATYKFNLPKGQYKLILHWAETDKQFRKEEVNRVFNVLANGKAVITRLNTTQAGFSTALSKKVILDIENQGLELSFESIEGDPIINAIEISKL